MPVPGQGGAKAREIQRLGTYIQSRVPGQNGTLLASDYEKYAADHPQFTAAGDFFGWVVEKGTPEAKRLAATNALAIHHALGQIVKGTEKGIERTAQNPIDRILGEMEKILIGLGKTAAGLATNPLGVLTGALTSRQTLTRIAEGVLGVALIAAGVYSLVNPASTLTNALKQISKAPLKGK